MNTNTQHPKLNKILGIACLAVLTAASTHAATWNGGTMSYNTPGNWSGGQVPSTSVLGNAVNNAGFASVVQVNPGDPDWVLGNQDILLGSAAGASGSYVQDGPTVTLNFWFRMGVDGNAGAAGYANVRSGTLNIGGQLDISEVAGAPSIFESTNTGIVNVGGELWVGNNFGADGTLNLSGTSRLTVNNWLAIGRNNSTGVLNLSGNASVTKTGGGNITLAGVGAPTGTLNQTGGAVTNETSETWLGENGNGTWNMTNGVASLGLLRFGANGGNGIFNLVGGTLMVNQINMGNSASSSLNFNGGTLMARGSSPNFMSVVPGVIQVGGAKIDSQGFSITIASTIQDDGSGGSLTKLGSGELALTGANTYLGPTVVNAGKLLVNETSTPNGSYTVAGGGSLSTSPSTANGQFNVASLTVAASSSLDFDLRDFGNPTTAPLNVTALTVNGAVSVNIADALPQLGQFPLIKYGSRIGSGTFVLGSLPIGVTATIVTNVGGSIDLNVTAVTAPRWDGQVNGTWDTVTTNWIELSTAQPAKYANGNAVLFNDAASGTTSVTLGVTVTPGRVTVNNTNLNYSLSGSGKISGLTSLVKQGTGSLALNTTNDYTGVTRLEGGTLSVTQLANGGVASAIGSSSASAANLVFGGGTLSYSGPALTTDRGYTINFGNSTLDAQSDMTFNGAINAIANGNFAKSGNGTLYVKRTGTNTLSAGGGGGAYNIVNGRVIMDGSASAQVNNVSGELWTGGATNSTSASLVLTNTTLNVSSWLSVARGTGPGGSTSSVALYNSKLRSSNGSLSYDNGIAGSFLTGLLTLNGTSTYTNTGDGNMGESSGGTAIITLNDSSVYFNNNRLQLGWHSGASGAGKGVLTVANSAKIIVNAWMSIGNEGGNGTVILKDNGSLACTDLNLCDVNDGTAELVAQDNSVVNAGLIFVGKGPGSTGTFTMSNNATVTSGNFILGGSNPNQTPTASPSTATANLSGGTLSVPLVLGQPNFSATTFNFNGGKLVATGSGSDFVFGLAAANVLAGGAVIEINTTAVRSIPQDLLDGGGGGGLTKLGTGSLLLNGTNTYTGNTVVSAGTLGGNGTIAGPVTIQSTATLAPGGATGIGTLTLSNNLALAGNVAVAVDTSASPSNDLVVVTGTLTKTGTGTLTVANLGPPLQVGNSFKLFSQPVVGGASLTVSGGGAVWNNQLAIDGSIQVVSLSTPAPNFTPGSVANLPDGNKSVTGTGAIGSTYKLWASTNVTLAPIPTTWTLLDSGTITASPFTFNDRNATNFPRRFYIFSAP